MCTNHKHVHAPTLFRSSLILKTRSSLTLAHRSNITFYKNDRDIQSHLYLLSSCTATNIDTFGYYAEGVEQSVAEELTHIETKAELQIYINSPSLHKMWDYYAFELAAQYYTRPLHLMHKLPPKTKQFKKVRSMRIQIDKAITPITLESKKYPFRSFLERWITEKDEDEDKRGISEVARYLLNEQQISEMYAITSREEGLILLDQGSKRIRIFFENAWDAYLHEIALSRIIDLNAMKKMIGLKHYNRYTLS